MKIQCLRDGLANQILQYVFVRSVERKFPGEKWFFDDSFFFVNQVHNGYELEKVFGVKVNLLSNYFDHETWEKIIKMKQCGIGLPQIMLTSGLSVVLVEENSIHEAFSGHVIRDFGFHSSIMNLPYDNVYYCCWWGDSRWFSLYEKQNRDELQFPPIKDGKNLEYANMIKNTYSVGIHVRRNGFLEHGWGVEPNSYRDACVEILSNRPDARFFIFSDDLDWCQLFAGDCGFNLAKQTVYIQGNNEPNNYIDMQLLSMCKGMIRNGASTFSGVAGMLNATLEFDKKLMPDGALKI